MHPFRKAVEARDVEAMTALLADDVIFISPVAFKPYAGKAITSAILETVDGGVPGLPLRARDRGRGLERARPGVRGQGFPTRPSPAATSSAPTATASSTTSW